MIVMAGMLAFLFAAAFECSSPFWKLRGNQCINQVCSKADLQTSSSDTSQTGFWIAFGLFDIISDIYSVSVVIWVSKDLKLQTPNKIKLLVILASKFLYVFSCLLLRTRI